MGSITNKPFRKSQYKSFDVNGPHAINFMKVPWVGGIFGVGIKEVFQFPNLEISTLRVTTNATHGRMVGSLPHPYPLLVKFIPEFHTVVGTRLDTFGVDEFIQPIRIR